MLPFPTNDPNRSTRPRIASWLCITALFVFISGCASNQANTTDPTRTTPLQPGSLAVNRSPIDETRPDETRSADRTIALLIEGEPVTWATLRPLLAEAGGGEVVEELTLEHALRKAIEARGLTVGQTQIDAARDSWLALLEDSGMSVDAESEIRRRRGLGDERFRRLLWRNAALRALIDPAEIRVSDSEVGLARTIRTGRRYLVTGVIARDSSTSLAIAGQTRSARAGTGASLAGELWSAASDRDLTPFRSVVSPLDPAFPESIRRSLASIGVGAVSSPIALDRGFAVIVVDGVIDGAASEADGAGSVMDAVIRRELAIRKTRVAMERLARSLIDGTEVNPLDRSLRR